VDEGKCVIYFCLLCSCVGNFQEGLSTNFFIQSVPLWKLNSMTGYTLRWVGNRGIAHEGRFYSTSEDRSEAELINYVACYVDDDTMSCSIRRYDMLCSLLLHHPCGTRVCLFEGSVLRNRVLMYRLRGVDAIYTPSLLQIGRSVKCE
jgi:hypothetical protein